MAVDAELPGWDLDSLRWDDRGLIATVAQDRHTGVVRMVAWANREALVATLDTRKAHFFSRSRGSLWMKGGTSGHVLDVCEVWADCDGDTLIYLVDARGPTCHTGRETCFYRRLDVAPAVRDGAEGSDYARPTLLSLEATLRNRASSTARKSYTRSLLEGGPSKVGAKVAEEAAELVAAIEGETDARVISEAADLTYHMLVGLLLRRLDWAEVLSELGQRSGTSGHDEKASREPT